MDASSTKLVVNILVFIIGLAVLLFVVAPFLLGAIGTAGLIPYFILCFIFGWHVSTITDLIVGDD